jgi:hypothetical protein
MLGTLKHSSMRVSLFRHIRVPLNLTFMNLQMASS